VKNAFAATARRAAGIVAVSFAAAAADFALRGAMPWKGDWENYAESRAIALGAKPVTLRGLLDSRDAVLLDARPRAAYDAGHIPGALSFPAEAMDEAFADAAGLLAPERAVLAYCDSPSCDEALQVLEFLSRTGLTNLLFYAGGWEEWSREAPRLGKEGTR